MTDSNFLTFDNVLKAVFDRVLPYKLFKNREHYEEYKMRVLNVLSCFTTEAITQTLFNYLGHVNMPEEDRVHIRMKNEFYYSRVIITHAKKSYIGLQKRQEKVVFKKPKLDVKGVNFFKSTASEGTSAFIYQDVLMDQLLQPKDGVVSLSRTYKVIHDFQQRITGEIAQGAVDYLKRSIKVKSPDAYANPMSNGQYKAVWVWNVIHQNKDRIDLPGMVTLVKVRLRTKADVAKLEGWPDIYNKIMGMFENNPEVGDYIDPKTGKKVRGKGIRAIAIPAEMDEVPEWIVPIIDVPQLVADNMALFSQLYLPLGLSKATVSSNGASLKYYSNIVRI